MTLMEREMHEQPRVLAALADRFAPLRADVAARFRDGLPGVAFLARGSSDHAALLGRYAVELYSGLPTCLIAPSLSTAYDGSARRFAGWLVVALSQSGRTPEIVDLAGQFRRAGARVIGISNDATSELAAVADLGIELAAGPERAVPATKTVTAQMLAVLTVAAAVGPDEGGPVEAEIAGLAAATQTVLADDASVRALVAELLEVIRRGRRLAVVGRGLCYAAALETALKLQETTGVLAHGFSAADFRHGPIAVCGPDAPAVLVAGHGPADEDTLALMPTLRERSAPVAVLGGGPGGATWPELGGAADCVLATVRGQQLALELSRALGIDPDHPAGLSKVTLTH